MITVGDSNRWWNWRLPIAKFLIAATLLCVGAVLWLFCGEIVHDYAWGISHDRTATFRGQSLKVPWGWREEEWTNYNQFTLQRDNLELKPFGSSVTIAYDDSGLTSLQSRIEVQRRLDQIVRVRDSYLRNSLFDPKFTCSENGTDWSRALFITCFSLDGRWTVSFVGSTLNRSDFAPILHGVAAMRTPSK